MADRQKTAVSDIERAAVQILCLRAVEKALGPNAMGVTEIRERLKGAPGADSLNMRYGSNGSQIFELNGRKVTMPPLASDDEIYRALTVIINIKTVSPMGSVLGLEPGALQAKVDEAKKRARDRFNQALARVSDGQEKASAKLDAAVDGLMVQIDKETDAAIHELAQTTNGGPA